MKAQLDALESIHVTTAPTPDEVWEAEPVTYHADGLHPRVTGRLRRALDAIESNRVPNALVVQGERGSGKTHLLAWTRGQIHERDGFFFYMKLVTGHDFWESATNSLVDSLYRKGANGEEQLQRLLGRLSSRVNLDDRTASAIAGERPLTRTDLETFIQALRRADRQVGKTAADTARALALTAAASADAVETGTSYLAMAPDQGERAAWGMSAQARPAQLLLRDLTRLLALAGPVVFAFDQLDNLISASESTRGEHGGTDTRAAKRLSSAIADGLMDLREEARRTLIVVACQPDTWDKISRTGLRSAIDRFEVLPPLGQIPDENTAAEIITNRFGPVFRSIGFQPDYDTWPVQKAALAESVHRYSARRLLLRVVEHINNCVASGVVSELSTLASDPVAKTASPSTPSGAVSDVDRQFSRLRDTADVRGPLDKDQEDRLMPSLLGAGLRALVAELGGDEGRFMVETEFGRNTTLHARLRYIVDERTENEIHWSFRAVAADHPISAQTRLRKAVIESGIEQTLQGRRLVLLRNMPFPRGAKADELWRDFERRGGRSVPTGAPDLRTLHALSQLEQNHPTGFGVWLRESRPASTIEIFSTVLDDLREHVPQSQSQSQPAPSQHGAPGTAVVLGSTVRGERPYSVALDLLSKHAVVIGGAGSGKTVLIKRIVEQCALRGVSAIVLDPNDDLGRLGDPWPERPKEWTGNEEQQAETYFADTEVVTWTPGLTGGRPLSFRPLPDFSSVKDDPDDFRRMIDSATDTLAAQAKIRGDGARATKQRAVLQRALVSYAREGGASLQGLIDLLAEPPNDVARGPVQRLAVDIADTLDAAVQTDPLFGESGDPADPGMLLTPSKGRAARISVISFVGLAGVEQRENFVSRLQTALFTWFKVNPTRDRPLGGLLVMDEAQNFVPSGTPNASTASTISLIRQVRKYGLGMVLASQAPKGLNNQATGNTANQFIGRVTVPAQIAAAEAMAQSRASRLGSLGDLQPGEFYAAGEGAGFTRIRVPMCLSYHAGPLQEEEIVERALRIA